MEDKKDNSIPWGRVWTHGADVMATWRRYGFIPPTDYRDDYLFKINREAGLLDEPPPVL